jgi:hypothetical protein
LTEITNFGTNSREFYHSGGVLQDQHHIQPASLPISRIFGTRAKQSQKEVQATATNNFLNRLEFLGTAAMAASIGVVKTIGSGLPAPCSPHKTGIPENRATQGNLAYIGVHLRS